jgi:hypothetical protein
MEKLDLRKQLKQFYAPSLRKIEIVDVPPFNFAMIDGAMQPGEMPGTSPAFQEAVEALYGISYTLKFTSKLRKSNPIDYTVMALEGLWWIDEGEFDITRPGNWKWTLMILQPEHIGGEMFQDALRQLARKKDSPALSRLHLEGFHEGLCMQTMHVGPYADEPATIARMHAFAEENGYRLRGKHHEIYLGDPRRSKPDKLKTILRQTVAERLPDA